MTASKNTYQGTDVRKDTTYYYRIFPSAYRNVTSGWISAVPGYFRGSDEKTGGLSIYDVSKPSNPGEIDSVTPVYVDTVGTAQGIAIYGAYAFVAATEGLDIVDISVSGRFAYIADGTAGLSVMALWGSEE